MPDLPPGFRVVQQPGAELPPGFRVVQPENAPAAIAPGSGMVAGDIIGQMAGGALAIPQASPHVAQAAQSMAALPQGLAGLPASSRAFQTGTMEGMTGNFLDEINAGLMTPVEMLVSGTGNPIEAYQQAYERNRDLTQTEVAANPAAATAGNVAGALVTAGTLAQGGASMMARAQPTIASMAGRGAAEGALYGAAYGAGSGESLQERATQAGFGALTGGALGGIGGAVAGGVAQAANRQAVPSVAELRAQASSLYDQARNSGVTFPQAVTRQAADDIAARAISEGLDTTLHPGAAAALRRLQEAGGQGMTAQQAQTMRRVLQAAARSPTNPDQARIASIMIDMFDQQITGAIPQLAQANALYAQARRGQLLEDAFTRARDRVGTNYNNAGMVTALRQEFARILNNQNTLRGFSDAETEAMRAFVRGGPAENFLRWVGRFAPTGVFPTAGVIGSGAGAGALAGSPGTGAAVAGGLAIGGMGARAAGNAMAMNNANRIAAMVRNGAPLPTIPLPAQFAAEGSLAMLGQQAHQIPEYLLRSTAEQPAY